MGSLIDFRSNGGTASGYLALPEGRRGPAVIVIQEWWGLDSGTKESAKQVWTAPQPGVTVERMDLLSTARGSSPDTGGALQVQQSLPAGYDWTTADSINFSVDGPNAFGARVDVAPVLHESAQHPSGSYLFGQRGWMDAADVQRENQKSFLTVCTPDPN